MNECKELEMSVLLGDDGDEVSKEGDFTSKYDCPRRKHTSPKYAR